MRTRSTFLPGLVCALLAVPGLQRATDAQPVAGGTRATGATLRVVASDASSGAPLHGALVTIAGIGFTTRTDSAGEARIVGIPEGIRLVEIRLLGYAPRTAALPFLDGEDVGLTISLAPNPVHLPPVRAVVATSYAPWLREFQQRRLQGVGRFITEPEIRGAFGSDLGALLMSRVPGVRIQAHGAGSRFVYTLRGPGSISHGGCQAAVYLDGVRVPDGDAGEVSLNQLGGIEYYTPSTVPARYREPGLKIGASAPRGGSATCGVLLLWTRP